jgi:NADPH:quinone reductase-like Zn-dependent oxidoreductase
MHAIAITEYGGDPAVTELPKPAAASDKMVVRVEAAGMNPVDRSIASGAYKDLMPATFPLVLGVDMAGIVEAVGGETAGFDEGDRVFGQLMIPPLGSTGTYAEFVFVPKDAPVAKVPQAMDAPTAASLPTAGGTALQIAESLSPLEDTTMLIVGAAGGVGSFLTQFAVRAGAQVIADVAAGDSARIREYGAAETIDYHTDNVHAAVATLYPEGIDVLVDLANDAGEFAELASLVRSGGTALTTRYVADTDSLTARGVTGVNFAYQPSRPLLAQLADAVATGGVVPPPLATVALDDVPQVLRGNGKGARPAKTVIAVS